jgi:hypothetical protein
VKVHATSEFPAAVVVDEQAISRLWEHVIRFCGEASATLTCVDGIERYFHSLESLLGYENPLRARVTTIEIHGWSRDPEQSITITVGRSYGSQSTLSIRGEEQEVSALQTRVMDTFSGMRAWYSAVARVDLFWMWPASFMIVALVARLKVPSEPASYRGLTLLEALHALVIVALWVSIIGVVIVFTAKMRARFFPRISFAFGQGARRHQLNEQVRWSVIIGLIVGVAGSFVYALIGGA